MSNRELITKEGPSQIERLFHLYLFSFSSTTAYLHESKRSVNKGSGAGMESCFLASFYKFIHQRGPDTSAYAKGWEA